MTQFYALYPSTDGEEWEVPMHVSVSKKVCREVFADWIKCMAYDEISFRIAPVNITETNDQENQ